MNVSIVIPTYNAEKNLESCLKNLVISDIKPNILVIDSSSTDRTIEIAKKYDLDHIIIPQRDFNFGYIREKYRKYKNAEVFIALSQDAYACDKNFVKELIEPLFKENVVISYARQIPKNIDNPLESIPRLFNYPSSSHVRSIKDIKKYGVYTFFCSNSAAAYSNDALDSVGGFPEVLLHEDHLIVAKLLQKGLSISYSAEAKIYHSHDYTVKQEFSRYFDIGYVVSTNIWYKNLIYGTTSRGVKLSLKIFRSIIFQNPQLLPKYILTSLAKYFGYTIGLNQSYLPDSMKKYFSGQKYYWDSKYYKRKKENTTGC